MNREQILQAARDEIAKDKAAIEGMAPNEKHAFVVACILVALLVAAGMIIARLVF